jgi:hypothetical protein
VFSPDDHYFVIANDITFQICGVDMAGNYSEKGPRRHQNGSPTVILPSGVEKLTFADDSVFVVKGHDGKEYNYIVSEEIIQ